MEIDHRVSLASCRERGERERERETSLALSTSLLGKKHKPRKNGGV